MTDIEDKADRWDVDNLQQDIWDLEHTVREQQKTIANLQMAITLLTNDLNTIKLEGCWRFVENPTHTHKDDNNGI